MGILADSSKLEKPATFRPRGDQPYPVSNAHQPIGQQEPWPYPWLGNEIPKNPQKKTVRYKADMNTYDYTNFRCVKTSNELIRATPWLQCLGHGPEHALPKEGTSKSARLTKSDSVREAKPKRRQ